MRQIWHTPLMYKFETPLIKAKFLKRYKRFFVDAELPNGTIATAHCANTGSMKGLLDENNFAWLMPVDNPKAKLKYKLQFIETPTSMVGVNTALPNHIVKSALTLHKIKELKEYSHVKPEVKYGKNSRIDLLLTEDGLPDCYVEIKNVTLAEGKTALFPDAVTTRGAKHLNELIDMVKQGHRAVMLYLVQREDCTSFSIAKDIDPIYAKTLHAAVAAGVDILCYSCHLTPKHITLAHPLPIKI